MTTSVIYGQVIDGNSFLSAGVTIDAIAIDRVRRVARVAKRNPGWAVPPYLAARISR
jgi:hypothetical protein